MKKTRAFKLISEWRTDQLKKGLTPKRIALSPWDIDDLCDQFPNSRIDQVKRILGMLIIETPPPEVQMCTEKMILAQDIVDSARRAADMCINLLGSNYRDKSPADLISRREKDLLQFWKILRNAEKLLNEQEYE